MKKFDNIKFFEEIVEKISESSNKNYSKQYLF